MNIYDYLSIYLCAVTKIAFKVAKRPKNYNMT